MLMWGAAKPWQHLHRCPSGVCPQPICGQAKVFGFLGKRQGPHRVTAHQCPRGQGQPGPATSLPGTKWGIEGHSRALSALCLPGRGRLPSAGSLGPVLPPQLQGTRGTHGNRGTHGTWGTQGARPQP